MLKRLLSRVLAKLIRVEREQRHTWSIRPELTIKFYIWWTNVLLLKAYYNYYHDRREIKEF